jgi:aldose 1-epimerase
VGGALRAASAEGRDVVEPFPVDAPADGAHGMPLVPWPNRVGDGRYSFDGRDLQLALTEPDRHNAIHGLLRWVEWEPVQHEADRVVVAARIHPQPGYPWDLGVQVEYALAGGGLTVTTTATNLGAETCPYATGQHPYLSPGQGLVDACTLTVSASTRLLCDERGLPTGEEPVAGTAYDWSAGRRLGEQVVDHAFTDLGREADGLAWTRLRGPDGATVGLWQDASYGVLQVFTGDTLAPGRRRTGLAAEPMTAPPDAFRTGTGVQRLDPGTSTTSRWGLTLS